MLKTIFSRSSLSAVRCAKQIRMFSAHSSLTEATGVTGKKHRSNAEDLVAKSKIYYIDGPMAVCDGGGGSLGHPIQYIGLDTVEKGQVVSCKYCSTKFAMKEGAVTGHH